MRVSWTLDKTSPAVILATSSPSLTNQSSMVVTVNFSESVSGLSLSDILVTNAVASNLLGSGASYSFTVSPLTDGPVVIEIGSAAAMDAAGNPNTQSNTLSFVSDRSNPATPTFLLVNDSGVNPSDRITNDGRMIVSGLEPLAVWQYSLTGGLLWITGSGTTFVVPDGQYLSGIIRIRQSDAAGNPSFEGFNSASVTVDTVAPVVLFAPIQSPVSSSLKSISFSFTETTYGVVPNDFRLFRDGEAVALVGTEVTGSGMNWAVNNLANFNRIQGGYRIVLTAAGSAITDSAGNFLSLNADREWLVQSIKPSAPRTLTGIPGAGQVLLSWSGSCIERLDHCARLRGAVCKCRRPLDIIQRRHIDADDSDGHRTHQRIELYISRSSTQFFRYWNLFLELAFHHASLKTIDPHDSFHHSQ